MMDKPLLLEKKNLMINLIQFSLLSLLMSIYPAYAIDWGHLVTGTTDQLEKRQTTIGTTILGYGLHESVTIGTSPMMFLGYDFYSFISRISLFEVNNNKTCIDFFLFRQ
jgi:hypothetical protein